MAEQGHGSTRASSNLPRTKKRGNEDPKMIGQWKIGKTIGKGSSGRVKVARHAKTNQYAAVKIVSKNALITSRMSMSEAPAHAEKVLLGIEREIVIMKLMDHPNVLNLYDVWETGNELYLIMEYVEGGELFDYLVSRGRLPLDEALRYFQQIISAVSYCHGFNIAHRDLKPENLLLSKCGSIRNIKVADFGMAAYTDPASMLSTSCGSPHYASPEVVEGRTYKGNISDIWSCGVILYALLAGRLPFDDENLRILLEKVKLAKYEMPTDIPASAQDLVARMLEKDVNRRITMAQILRHPFFLTFPPSPSLLIDAQTPTLDQLSSIGKPVRSEDEIDADIFDNLRTLWHGAPVAEIIESLLNEEKTWEKAVYHLLLKYRSRHLENYNIDEDDEEPERQFTRQSHEPQALTIYRTTPVSAFTEDRPILTLADRIMDEQSKDQAYQDKPGMLTSRARPSAPTPQRAFHNGEVIPSEPSSRITPSTLRGSDTAAYHTPRAIPLPVMISTTELSPAPRDGNSNGLAPPFALPIPSASELVRPVSAPPRPVPATSDDTTARSANLRTSSQSLMFELPGIDVSSVQDVDEAVKRFFHQITERLNTVPLKQTNTSIATPPTSPHPVLEGSHDDRKTKPGHLINSTEQNGSSSDPAPSALHPLTESITPNDSRFEDAAEDLESLPPKMTDPPGFGLGFPGRYSRLHPTREAPPPPSQHQSPIHANNHAIRGNMKHTRVTEKPFQASDKENISVKSVEHQPSSRLRKKSSVRKAQGERKLNRHVQIVLPPEDFNDVTAKKRKSTLSTRSAENSPSLSEGPFSLLEQSGPRRSWFGNLFHFKPASYNLLSVHDAYTTMEECAYLLSSMGVAVIMNPEVLKCKLEKIKDPIGVMKVTAAVRFRVELQHVNYAHSVAGYLTSLKMVQEKGALSSFRLVYNRLRREWNLDAPAPTIPFSLYGPIPMIHAERLAAR